MVQAGDLGAGRRVEHPRAAIVPLLPVATRVPSGLNATADTPPSWSRREISAPVAASNTRALPSPLPVATRVPSGLNATAYTPPSWSRREISAPVAASNTRALPLTMPLPVATRVPSGLNATADTPAVVVQAGDLGAGRRVEHPRAAIADRRCRWPPGCRPG